MNFDAIKQNNRRKTIRTRIIKLFVIIAITTIVITFFNMRSTIEIDEYVIISCGAGTEKKEKLNADKSLKTTLSNIKCNIDSDDFIEVNNEVVSINAKINDNDKIIVFHVETEEVVKEEIIAYDKQIIYDSSLEAGQSIIDPGVNGKRTYTYKHTYINRELIKKERVNVIELAPVSEITIIGTRHSNSHTTTATSSNTSNNSTSTSGSNNSSGEQSQNNYNTNEPVDCKITVNGIEYPCE